MSGNDETGRVGLFRIDAHTGEAAAVARNDDRYLAPAWSRDGRSVMYSTGDVIYSRDLESGQVRELYSGQAVMTHLSLSPDGRHLAFMGVGDGTISLRVMPVGGGDAWTVLTDESINYLDGALAWMPDGSQLLFEKGLSYEAGYEQTELWRISIEGGEPERTELAMAGLSDFHLHPDGRRIAFTVRINAFEVWVMENFLAELGGTK